MATRSTKTASKAKTAPKTAATKAAVPKTTIVETVTPVVAGAPIKKPELIDRVVAETGMKKKDVKPVVEAMLGVLGRALSDGEDITAPPLGKVMIKRVKDVANARVMNIKVRYPNATGAAPASPVADAAE